MFQKRHFAFREAGAFTLDFLSQPKCRTTDLRVKEVIGNLCKKYYGFFKNQFYLLRVLIIARLSVECLHIITNDEKSV